MVRWFVPNARIRRKSDRMIATQTIFAMASAAATCSLVTGHGFPALLMFIAPGAVLLSAAAGLCCNPVVARIGEPSIHATITGDRRVALIVDTEALTQRGSLCAFIPQIEAA